VDVPAAVEEGAPEAATGQEAAAHKRQSELFELLRSVLPAATVEVIPSAERSYPDSMQREDMFQDLLESVPAKKRSNPKRVKAIEREVDIAVALKNKSVARSISGAITGPAPYQMYTLQDVLTQPLVPAIVPIVKAGRVLNLDKIYGESSLYEGAVIPRVLDDVEKRSEEVARLYAAGGLPETLGRGFFAYMQDLLGRDQAVLAGAATEAGWARDQDVIRTAPPKVSVWGLDSSLPKRDECFTPPFICVSPDYIVHDVAERSVRVLTADYQTYSKTGEANLIAPSDPSMITGYVILPPKAAMMLRPPHQPRELQSAIAYSELLTHGATPTLTNALRYIYSDEEGSSSPLQAWSIDVSATTTPIANWLESVIKYVVHPTFSLAPRTPQMMMLLDTLGIGTVDLTPSVADVLWTWIRSSQKTWRALFKARRAAIQKALDTEEPRTFQTVTGDDATLWTALRAADTLKDLMDDVERRNPAIAEAPTLVAASLLLEAQGDATPLVWTEIARLDARTIDLDPVTAAAALAASRAYTLRRKGLRAHPLLSLSATAPVKNTCPHVDRLEAIRNLEDNARSLRAFIEEFQGPKQGEWMTCVLCKEPCVCYHEIMELEARAQPARLEAIQKQILLKFGGERFGKKIICKNCGQPLQDIDYEEGVEWNDETGVAVVTASVLTEEQVAEVGAQSWKSKAAATITASITGSDDPQLPPAQKEIASALTTLLDRAGLSASPDLFRRIMRETDHYVEERKPPQASYEALYAKTRADPSKKPLPTFVALIDQIRVSALIALVTVALQTEMVELTVQHPDPACTFSRGGYPLNASAKPDGVGALTYISCVVAYIQRQETPWVHMNWSGLLKPEPRKKEALTMGYKTLQIVLGTDKVQPSCTPRILQALETARSNVTAAREQTLVSLKDTLPQGFRPEPFPVTAGDSPAIETNPLPAIQKAIQDGTSTEAMIGPVATALHQIARVTVADLHKTAKAVPVRLADIHARARFPLSVAQQLLRGTIPSATVAGAHLWPTFDTPIPEPVDQVVEEGIYFKLFLRYCYTGPAVGLSHEFNGMRCRQCGFTLGEAVETIDMAKKGAEDKLEKMTFKWGKDTLAAQQGPLKVEVTQASFTALTEAVRRRRIMAPEAAVTRAPWKDGLSRLVFPDCKTAELLAVILEGIPDTVAPVSEIDRATKWEALSLYSNQLRSEIAPLITGKPRGAVAMEMFDTLTDDPFIEGPRALQEYWCAKVEAASMYFTIRDIKLATWATVSKNHDDMMTKLVSDNSAWFKGTLHPVAHTVLREIAARIGPILRRWVQSVRSTKESGFWTVAEGRLLLRTFILEVWRDAVTTSSPMYRDIAADRENIAISIVDWTRALMLHAKQQFVRFSKEAIKRILQDRAALDRETIVQEFESIKDDDLRAAEMIKKQLRIGRWAAGANIQGLDADQFDFEIEQRRRMGIADPFLVEGDAAAVAAAAEDFGLSVDTGVEEVGYDMDQGAEGDNY